MDQEFQFLVNYRLLAHEGESLFWFMPVDYFEYEDLAEVVQSCPSHSLTIVTYYEGMEPLLELVRPYVRSLSWIKLGITHKEFRFKASLMNSTHFASTSFVQGIEPLDEEAFEYLEWLEEKALSELTEIQNWSNAA
jgi:hypothetical protein